MILSFYVSKKDHRIHNIECILTTFIPHCLPSQSSCSLVNSIVAGKNFEHVSYDIIIQPHFLEGKKYLGEKGGNEILQLLQYTHGDKGVWVERKREREIGIHFL